MIPVLTFARCKGTQDLLVEEPHVPKFSRSLEAAGCKTCLQQETSNKDFCVAETHACVCEELQRSRRCGPPWW
jgi:hypothetical protein